VSPAASGPACGSFVPSVARGLAPCLHAREQTPFSAGFVGEVAASPHLPSSWFGSTSTVCSAAGLRHVAVGAGSGVHEVGSGSTVGARHRLRRARVVRCRGGSGWTLAFLPSKVRISFGVRTASPRCRSPPAVPPSDASSLRSSRRSGSGSIALPSVRPARPVSRGVRGSSRAEVALCGWCVSARSRPTPHFCVIWRSPRRFGSRERVTGAPSGTWRVRCPPVARRPPSVRLGACRFPVLPRSCDLGVSAVDPCSSVRTRREVSFPSARRLRLPVIAHQGLVRNRAL